jgi:hypothetical protein
MRNRIQIGIGGSASRGILSVLPGATHTSQFSGRVFFAYSINKTR